MSRRLRGVPSLLVLAADLVAALAVAEEAPRTVERPPPELLELPELRFYREGPPAVTPRAGAHFPATSPSSSAWDDPDDPPIRPRTERSRRLVERLRWARGDPHLSPAARDLFVAGYAMVSNVDGRALGLVSLDDYARRCTMELAHASPYAARCVLDGLPIDGGTR